MNAQTSNTSMLKNSTSVVYAASMSIAGSVVSMGSAISVPQIAASAASTQNGSRIKTCTTKIVTPQIKEPTDNHSTKAYDSNSMSGARSTNSTGVMGSTGGTECTHYPASIEDWSDTSEKRCGTPAEGLRASVFRAGSKQSLCATAGQLLAVENSEPYAACGRRVAGKKIFYCVAEITADCSHSGLQYKDFFCSSLADSEAYRSTKTDLKPFFLLFSPKGRDSEHQKTAACSKFIFPARVSRQLTETDCRVSKNLRDSIKPRWYSKNCRLDIYFDIYKQPSRFIFKKNQSKK